MTAQMREDVQGSAIGVLKILQDKEDRGGSGDLLEEGGDSLEEPVTRVGRVNIERGRRQVRHPDSDLGDDPGQVDCPGTERASEVCWVMAEHGSAKRLYEREVRNGKLAGIVAV